MEKKVKEKKEIHIGEVIKKILKEKGLAQIWLGKQLFANAKKIYRVLNSPSIDCRTVRKISKIIDFDICDYCRKLEKKQEAEGK
jgi:predicted transcriptional regulator